MTEQAATQTTTNTPVTSAPAPSAPAKPTLNALMKKAQSAPPPSVSTANSGLDVKQGSSGPVAPTKLLEVAPVAPTPDAATPAPNEAAVTNPDATDAAAAELALELETAAQQDAIDYAAKYSEYTGTNDLHEDFYDKLVKVPGKNGVDEFLSVKDLKQGYLRRSDHSRLMNEAGEQKRQAQAAEQRFVSMFNDVRDNPAIALEVFAENYGDAYIDKLVEIRTQATQQFEKALQAAGIQAALQHNIPQEQWATDQRVLQAMQQEKQRLEGMRNLEREAKKNKRLAEEAARAQQATQQQSGNEDFKSQFLTNVKRFGDAALKAEGVKVNELSIQELVTVSARIMLARNEFLPKGQKLNTPNKEIIVEAARIIKEEIQDKQGAPRSSEPPMPTRQGMGGGSGAVQMPKPTSGKLSDLIKATNGGRRF